MVDAMMKTGSEYTWGGEGGLRRVGLRDGTLGSEGQTEFHQAEKGTSVGKGRMTLGETLSV